MPNVIPQSEWVAQLQAFTNRNAGRTTVLENLGPSIGAQEEERGYPLRGVAFDPHDRSIQIMLGNLASTDVHLTRRIANPTGIDILTRDGRDEALRVEHDGGQVLLELVAG